MILKELHVKKLKQLHSLILNTPYYSSTVRIVEQQQQN